MGEIAPLLPIRAAVTTGSASVAVEVIVVRTVMVASVNIAVSNLPDVIFIH